MSDFFGEVGTRYQSDKVKWVQGTHLTLVKWVQGGCQIRSLVTRKTPVQTIGYIKSLDYINFSVNILYSNYFVHTFILYIISIGE